MRLSIGHDSFGQKNMKTLASICNQACSYMLCIETGLISSRTFLFCLSLGVCLCCDV